MLLRENLKRGDEKMLSPIIRTLPALSLLLLAACPNEQSADIDTVETTSGSSGSSGSSGTTDEPVPTTGADPMPGTSTGEADVTGTDATTGSDDSTTGPEAPICGNGVVEENEECDDSFANNTLHGACLPGCVTARCGDGNVHAGVEECDFGDDVNEYKYGGCGPLTCTWAARCGDGKVDAPHEICDPGDLNGQGDETIECDLDCRFAGRMVFLSSVGFDGNLGGLAGADSRCRDLAATFDVTRADNYMAWLSDGKSSPLDRIHHGPEFDETPYVLRSGVQIAANFADLIDNGPLPGIDLTDTYDTVVDVRVWTNTAIDGSLFSDEHHCEGWGTASANYSARAGRNALPPDSPEMADWAQFGHWTSLTSNLCKDKRRLYCFEN